MTETSKPHLFISYASADRERVLELAADFAATGLDTWIDTAGIAGGTAYGTEIATALRESAAVLVMCTAASLASKNVRQEIMLAWRYERPIVPLLLEAVEIPDDVAYWLEGAEWVDVVESGTDSWISEVTRLLRRAGLEIAVEAPEERLDSGDNNGTGQIGNLKRPSVRIIGRSRETDELVSLIKQSRWITLTGTGGTGKTLLATEVANRIADDYQGGGWLVDLTTVRNGPAVWPMIASALDLEEAPGISSRDAVVAALNQAASLLLLDNLEQISELAPELDALLDVAPNLTLLATSRMPVRGSREWVYPVSQLALPDLAALPPPSALTQVPAIALFVERARQTKPDFVLTDGNARAVAEICHRLDGLPLAIELAAARIRLLHPTALLVKLSSRLSVLTKGSVSQQARHETLRDTIAWSHDLLSPVEQETFRRLAVFEGGASLQTALEVLTDLGHLGEEDTVATLGHLVDQSLVRSNAAESGRRLSMSESILEFASEQLHLSGEVEAASDSHARAFAALIASRESQLREPKPGGVVLELASDDANFERALSWWLREPNNERSANAALSMVLTLSRYWWARSQRAIALRHFEEAVAIEIGADPALRAELHTAVGQLAYWRGEYAKAQQEFEISLEWRRTAGDRPGEAASLIQIARIVGQMGDIATAKTLVGECLAIDELLGNVTGMAIARHELGILEIYAGDFEEASCQLNIALAGYRSQDVTSEYLAIVLGDIGTVAMLSGEPEIAIERIGESLTIWKALDNKSSVAATLANAGRAHQLAGRFDEAERILGESLEQLDKEHQPLEISLALYALGLVALERNERDRARGCLTDSLKIEIAAGEPWYVAERLEAIARLESMSDSARAAIFLGHAAGIRDDSGMPIPPVGTKTYAATVIRLKENLGEAEFEIQFVLGKTMNLDEISNMALVGRNTSIA